MIQPLKIIIMHNSKLLKWKIVASVLFLALLAFINSASAGLIMTGAYQQSATSFTPTWTVAPSLISGMSPSNQVGNFTANGTTPGVSALTDGAIGPVSSSANNIYANCGSGAGQTLTYVLPAQTYGYNLTNITVYSGWANGGRVGQGYTVLYSTVANPGTFIWLTNVSYAAGFSGNNPPNPISIQVQLSDSAGGVIASNVAAVKFDFTDPAAPADENGGSGYSEITVQGTVAMSVPTPMVSITTSNENGASPFTPTWTAETPDLIAGSLPSSSAGNFDADGSEGGLSVLTDGSVGVAGTKTTVVSCGASGGTSLIYTLTNSVNGSDVTNIVVYSMWGDSGRDGQYYILSYSSVLAPATFIPITTVYYLPLGNSGAQANRVAIFNPTGAPLATNVSRLKFDFAGPPGASSFNNGWQGYSEIVVQGTNSQALQSIGVGGTTLSPYPVVAPGTSVTASVPVIGPSPYFYQWRTDGGSGGALTNIPGATTSSNLVINTTGFAPGNYQYALLVSNNVSSVTSSVVVLTISQPNEISGVIGVKFGFTGGYATSDAPYPADNAGVASGQLVPPSYQPLTTVAN
ncbi:MAG TPA: hypothetical protein VGY56_12370, partial [Verrucomicrobiae bacterium]|nr:hypothetical protein [Verrucomicrobiae bacterium]